VWWSWHYDYTVYDDHDTVNYTLCGDHDTVNYTVYGDDDIVNYTVCGDYKTISYYTVVIMTLLTGDHDSISYTVHRWSWCNIPDHSCREWYSLHVQCHTLSSYNLLHIRSVV